MSRAPTRTDPRAGVTHDPRKAPKPSAQSWRQRNDTAPVTALGSLADPPIRPRGRPRKTDLERTRERQAAAQALVNAQIAKRAAERAGAPFTVSGALETWGAMGHKVTAEALIASGAIDDRAENPAENASVAQSVPPTEASETELGDGGSTEQSRPDRGTERSAPVRVEPGRRGTRGASLSAMPADQSLGGARMGSAERLPVVGPTPADLATRAAEPLPCTDIKPAPGGAVRVCTPSEADENLERLVYAMVLNGAWTEESVSTLAAEHKRAEHTIRMYRNRAQGRMDAPLAQVSVHENLYRRARVLSELALGNALSVQEPAYVAVALKSLEVELKVAGLLPKELPPVKSRAELEGALVAALAKVRAMPDGEGSGEGD